MINRDSDGAAAIATAKPNWAKRIILTIIIVPVVLLALVIGSIYVVTWNMSDDEISRAQNSVEYEKLRAATQTAISSTLNDPKSAQFRNVRRGGSSAVVCGEFNARNAFGGYVPFRRFYASSTPPVIGQQLEIEPVTAIERAALPDFREHYFANCGPD